MRTAVYRLVLLTSMLCVMNWCPSAQGDGCCAHCGCHDTCHKICRLVCEEKTVEITCWGYKYEDFCVPGPSCPKCKYREEVCGACDEEANQAGVCPLPKKFTWWSWCPNPCGTIYTKKKLMKKIVKKKVPSYKWVVEDLCQTCEDNAPAASVSGDTELPEVPVADAIIKVGPTAPPAPPVAPE